MLIHKTVQLRRSSAQHRRPRRNTPTYLPDETIRAGDGKTFVFPKTKDDAFALSAADTTLRTPEEVDQVWDVQTALRLRGLRPLNGKLLTIGKSNLQACALRLL